MQIRPASIPGYGIYAALDGMEIIEQIRGLTEKIVAGLGQLDATGITGKQHHVQPRLHALDGVADG